MAVPSLPHRHLTFLLAVAALAPLTGCQQKFTRERFEMIQAGVDQREDVEQILGRPEFTDEDLWYYEDEDHHTMAQIWFDQDGRVHAKEWMDAQTGAWEGRSPHAAPPPVDQPRERRRRTTTIEDD